MLLFPEELQQTVRNSDFQPWVKFFNFSLVQYFSLSSVMRILIDIGRFFSPSESLLHKKLKNLALGVVTILFFRSWVFFSQPDLVCSILCQMDLWILPISRVSRFSFGSGREEWSWTSAWFIVVYCTLGWCSCLWHSEILKSYFSTSYACSKWMKWLRNHPLMLVWQFEFSKDTLWVFCVLSWRGKTEQFFVELPKIDTKCCARLANTTKIECIAMKKQSIINRVRDSFRKWTCGF